MTEEKAGKAHRDPIEKASGNLEKALETISKRLLEQIKDGETPSRELGELAGDEAGGRDPAGAAGGARRAGDGRARGI